MTPGTQYAIAADFVETHAFINCKKPHARWILHQDSLLRKYQSLTLNSSPTLSYTQRLEQRVAQLEAALSEATKGADSRRSNHAAGDLGSTDPQTSLLLSEASEAHEIRRLSLHDSISLFQTNDVVRKSPIEADQAEQETAAKKESLMNSAWRERAYERLADIPVGISLVNEMIPG